MMGTCLFGEIKWTLEFKSPRLYVRYPDSFRIRPDPGSEGWILGWWVGSKTGLHHRCTMSRLIHIPNYHSFNAKSSDFYGFILNYALFSFCTLSRICPGFASYSNISRIRPDLRPDLRFTDPKHTNQTSSHLGLRLLSLSFSTMVMLDTPSWSYRIYM